MSTPQEFTVYIMGLPHRVQLRRRVIYEGNVVAGTWSSHTQTVKLSLSHKNIDRTFWHEANHVGIYHTGGAGKTRVSEEHACDVASVVHESVEDDPRNRAFLRWLQKERARRP